MISKMVDYKDSPYESEDQRGVWNYSDLEDTFKNLKE